MQDTQAIARLLKEQADRIRQLEQRMSNMPVRWGKGAGGASRVLVKITGNAAGGGKYTGRILRAADGDVTASTNVSEASFGNIPGADDALVINSREVGKSTHDIGASGALPLIFLGLLVQTNSDGKIVVAIDGAQWKDCDT